MAALILARAARLYHEAADWHRKVRTGGSFRLMQDALGLYHEAAVNYGETLAAEIGVWEEKRYGAPTEVRLCKDS